MMIRQNLCDLRIMTRKRKPLADRMAARGEVLMHDSGHGNGFVEEGQVAKATDA